ncbi:hypothetical protein [Cysteiniphilum sp. JM-1]|uniref:type IVB secretion system protein IcmW n=1 Tax=Cysteiniphilum sp. JM-1 TaxID=2610891 RepID=UPI0012440026|nr:hypothetical protein [Cysteiniphilum sp. JM-1]
MKGSLIKKVVAFWQSFNNSLINNTMINLEFFEHVRLPEPTLKQQEEIDHIFEHAYEHEMNDEFLSDLVSLLSQLQTPWLAYFMQQLHARHQDNFQALYHVLKTDDQYQETFTRCVIVERLQLLSQVFHSDRIDTVFQALDNIKQQSA